MAKFPAPASSWIVIPRRSAPGRHAWWWPPWRHRHARYRRCVLGPLLFVILRQIRDGYVVFVVSVALAVGLAVLVTFVRTPTGVASDARARLSSIWTPSLATSRQARRFSDRNGQ
jgi:hypothetical protein